MVITLLTISKQCSDVINTCSLELDLNFPILSELYDKIYDLYPKLNQTEYNLYWRYNKDTFYLISNYLSYFTVLALMVDKALYLVLNDCDRHCEENEKYLRYLDEKELKEKRERERDIYDVKIKRPGDPDSEETVSIEDEIPTVSRTDAQIITYAIRKHPVPKYFTSDLIFKSNLVRDLKKGWPKLKNKLTHLSEEIIIREAEKVTKKDSKGKKGGKDDKKKKKK